MGLSQAIKQARKTAGLTQSQLGERVEATQASVSFWETGKATPPWAAILKIAKACDLTAEELVALAVGVDRDGEPEEA